MKTVTLAEVAVLLFDPQCERESKQMERQSDRHSLTPFRGRGPNRLPHVQCPAAFQRQLQCNIASDKKQGDSP